MNPEETTHAVEKDIPCPLCQSATIEIDYLKGRDGAWRASCEPCEFCGHTVNPVAMSTNLPALREEILAKPQTHVGQLAQWTTKGTVYDGSIEMFLEPGFDCRGLGKHGVRLDHGARSSKYPRYLLRTGKEYHAVLTRSVFIVPTATDGE